MVDEQTEKTQAEAKSVEKEAAQPALLGDLFQKLNLEAPGAVDIGAAVSSEQEREKLPAEILVFTRWALQAERPIEKVDGKALEALISQIDRRLSAQLNAVFTNPDFQKMESSWRSLKFLVERTNFRDGKVKLDVLNVSKQDLLDDFMDAPELPQAGLYRHIYQANFDMYGGFPYGAMVGNYEFERGAQDMALLQKVSQVAAASHCPFVSAVGKDFFGLDDVRKLYSSPDIKAIFDQVEYTKWKSFRDSEDSRYVALTCPRFLLRLPYGPGDFEEKVKEFSFDQQVTGEQHEHYLWGNSAYAMASNMVRSFDKYGWCSNVVGPTSGGSVEDLPVHLFQDAGEMVPKCPTETPISDTNAVALDECGLIPLVFKKNADSACFFDAMTANKPKRYNKADATANAKLSAMLYNIFLHSRFSHYLKIIQRQNIGSFREAPDLEREMNEWLKGYVTEDESAPLEARAKYPLKKAQVTVSAIESDPGWYRVQIYLRPWFKLRGMDVDISLVTRMPTGKK